VEDGIRAAKAHQSGGLTAYPPSEFLRRSRINPAVMSRPGPGALARLRNYFIAGLLVLAPLAVTLWVFYRLLNWVDNLLGQYLRFPAFDYHRIPGIGLVATLLLLVIVGWLASWLGSRSLFAMLDTMLTRIPGLGILYGSTKSLGEAFLKQKQSAFRQVVLVQWPYPGIWRIGLLTGPPSPSVRQHFDQEMEVVFVPHTPNPASGFVHYVPKSSLVYLDWPVEDGLKVVVSGGVVQPPGQVSPLPAASKAPDGARTL
jgi:uncharacterized membrane protein